MLRLVLSVVVIAMVAAAVVPQLQQFLDAQATAKDDQAVAAAAPRASGGARLGDVVVEADDRGHFLIDARAGGQRLAMLADTGATVVALRASDARRIGLRPLPADYRHPVSTANGTVDGARVTIPDLTVGRIRLSRVDALVLPDAALGSNLLGMSFLKRLSRFEVADGRLVMAE